MLDAITFLLGGVCHQLPEHSYWVGGQPLPLCARCTGTFLGIWAGLIAPRFLGRGRRTGLPSGLATWLLGVLAAFWALDGLNSTATMALGRSLYVPSNLLRLASGAGMGATLSALVAPMTVLAFGTIEDPSPIVESPGDIAALVVAAILVVVAVQFGGWLPYAAWAIALGAAVLGTIGVLNAVLVRLLVPRLGPWGSCLLGVALALGELAGMAALRRLLQI
ncbi:MAG: DUF2085 domain-containing protein [Anaerolineae bacterium]